MQIIQGIRNKIYDIRGARVLLDYDLADLYQVGTKVLNQAVKRNIKRFPEDFMFRLTELEWMNMRSQFVTASDQNQPIAFQNKRNRTITPYAFTEQGVAMLSGILNSDRAIDMNIAIMRAFVELRRIMIQENGLLAQFRQIKERLAEHDVQLTQIYDALEHMLNEKAAEKKWEERERIGFKKPQG